MFRSSTFDKMFDKATNNFLLEPDWPTILQICDLIRQNDVPPKTVLAAIKKKLTHQNPHTAYYALLVLESCVKNCGSRIHDEIGKKEYMEQLKELVKTTPHDNVKQKALELIQAWAHAFRNIPKYRAVQDTLNIMKSEGHKFPSLKESDAMFTADTAPEWTDGDCCHRCRTTFSLVQRKHHCRACGQVFCAHCSSKTTTVPKYGFEKEVRVCEACYALVNKSSTPQPRETDLPIEYLNSSLAQRQQVPPTKTEDEIQEEEELQLALALSQSEAEQKEREKKRATSAFKSNSVNVSRTTYSPPLSSGSSPSKLQDEDEVDPELAKYLNRKYWEQKQIAIEDQAGRAEVTSPSAPNISSPMPQKVVIAKQQNGEVDTEMEDFVNALRSQVEIFVNRMKSDSSRGRPISTDTSVQTLFMNITRMHSRLLTYIQEQDDSRVYYEGLQDKLTQIKDARAALDALRDEHKEKLRRQAEEAERQRQLLMAQKLAIMRKKKQDYLQYQRQLALQKIQEQEREMQMRQEQQKQQYMMGGYPVVSGYMGHSQGSPVRHMQYQGGPPSNYNPMSPTSQGVYMYGQHSIPHYSMQNYGVTPPMGSLPPHIISGMPGQEAPPTDPSIQTQDNATRVAITNTAVLQQPPNQGPQVGGTVASTGPMPSIPQVVGLSAAQMGQQPITGLTSVAHVSGTPIQVPAGGGLLPPNQTMQGASTGSAMPTMQGMPHVSTSQGQSLTFQQPTTVSATNEAIPSKEESKSDTAELISFD